MRIITFYEELFEEGGSLESGFCRFSRALSRFMKSCLTKVVRLKAVSVVFRARFMKSCLTRVVRLKAVSVVFRAHYRVL